MADADFIMRYANKVSFIYSKSMTVLRLSGSCLSLTKFLVQFYELEVLIANQYVPYMPEARERCDKWPRDVIEHGIPAMQ